jgi:hypothetical protein
MIEPFGISGPCALAEDFAGFIVAVEAVAEVATAGVAVGAGDADEVTALAYGCK